MANVRVSQYVFEVATLLRPNVRICQYVFEVSTLAIPPSITCGNPPNATQGQAYSHAFPASGGLLPYTFSITGSISVLPPGTSLNPSTGVISGIPTQAGLFAFTIQVTDANLLSATVNCSIYVVGVLRITFRGVKRVKACPTDPKESEVPQGLPSVKRAM